jgi:hypothetical protein
VSEDYYDAVRAGLNPRDRAYRRAQKERTKQEHARKFAYGREMTGPELAADPTLIWGTVSVGQMVLKTPTAPGGHSSFLQEKKRTAKKKRRKQGKKQIREAQMRKNRGNGYRQYWVQDASGRGLMVTALNAPLAEQEARKHLGPRARLHTQLISRNNMSRARRNEEDAPWPGPGYTPLVGPLADMAPQNFGYLSESYDWYKDTGAIPGTAKYVVVGYKYPSRGKAATYTVLIWDDESVTSEPVHTTTDRSHAEGHARYVRGSHDKNRPRTVITRRNMAGRPGKHGLPRYEGPRPAGLQKLTKRELKAWGSVEALAELEWRRLDKAMRSGMASPPARAAKRPPAPRQTTGFAPGFSAAPDVEKGQQVFRLLLHGQPIPSQKMPAGRYALNMERAAQLSHKLDPHTGERLRFGKTKSQRLGTKAAANPRTWRGAQSKKTRSRRSRTKGPTKNEIIESILDAEDWMTEEYGGREGARRELQDYSKADLIEQWMGGDVYWPAYNNPYGY